MKSTFVRSWPLVALTTATLAATACSSGGSARAVQAGAALPRSAGTTSSSGLLAADHLFVRSALQVDMSNHTVRLPLHKGAFRGKTVWYIMTEASDFGIAHDLNINFSPKLANMGIGCKVCVQDVTLTGKPTNKFGEAIVNFAGVPDFSPTRKLSAGPMAFPPAAAAPGAVGDARYSPFIRIAGSSVVYNAPIVAVGDAQFDVDHHTNTADRVMAIQQSKSAGPGQFFAPSVDILFVSGLEAGQKILYLSTEASDPMAATLERATFVPLLNNSSFVGGDDTLGSARERIFIFANGQTGASNPRHKVWRIWFWTVQHHRTQASPTRGCWMHSGGTATPSMSSATSRRCPIPATPTLTARCGTPRSASGRRRQSPRNAIPDRATRTRFSTWPPVVRTC